MKFSNHPFHPFYYHQQWIDERLKVDESLNELPTIPEFFANQDVLITGGSGFIGKVLIEKLLRSCPHTKTIYLLLRPKKGQSVTERIDTICNQITFEALRQIYPDFKNKLVPIEGDVMKVGLGLSAASHNLIKNVSILFHSAASVRFDDKLTDAVLMNTRGTLEIMKLAETLSNIKVVMHVSTTYSNVHINTVKEEIYPGLADWRQTIEICEKSKRDELNFLTPHYMNFMPNTYVFSKNLAEQVSYEFRNKLPLIVFRPSIVLNAWEEPFGGYVDNFNGPMGVLLASHIGISKTMYCDSLNVMDLTPVDVCAKAMIIGAWKRAHESLIDELPVINAASSNQIKCTLKQLLDIGIHGCCDEFPMGELTVTVPSGGVTLSFSMNLIRCFLFQLIPATILDAALKMKGQQPKVMKIQRKIFEANKALTFFVTNNWNFENKNFLKLSAHLKPEDIRAFEYRHFFKGSVILYVRYILYGYRKYLLNLKDEDIEKDRRLLSRLKSITLCFKLLFYSIMIYVVYKIFGNTIINYF